MWVVGLIHLNLMVLYVKLCDFISRKVVKLVMNRSHSYKRHILTIITIRNSQMASDCFFLFW